MPSDISHPVSRQADTSSAVQATVSAVREGVIALEGSFALHHGATLPSLQIGWRCEGNRENPLIVALGGISAHRAVSEWWSAVVAPGGPIASDRYQILSFDYLGGSGNTTGPKESLAFPSISTFDQAEVLRRLMGQLGIESIHAFVGASYGGMVGLAFAERYPKL